MGPSPTVTDIVLATTQAPEPSPTPMVRIPEPVKLSASLRAEHMEVTGSHLMRVNRNRCLRVAGVVIYLGKLLRSTPVKALWDLPELMVVSMEGELVAKFNYPFPEGATHLSLKHATSMFQNLLTERQVSPVS